MKVNKEAIDRINDLERETNRFKQLLKILDLDANFEIRGIFIHFVDGSTPRIPIDLAGEVINKVVIPAYEESAERILGEETNEDQ